MRLLGRFSYALAVFCFAAISIAQQGAAGYGQGGQGGGFGGGGGGMGGFGGGGYRGAPGVSPNSGDRDRKVKVEDQESSDSWDTRTAVLTPGDRVEYKLKVKAGETIFAGVTSDAFDPALDIEDEKGAVLAKNDDRVDGDQSPFLEYRFPKDGNYLLKVLSYRSVAGGKFTLKMWKFQASDAPLGLSRHEDVSPATPQRPGPVMFRLSAKKDTIYDLRNVFSVEKSGGYGAQFMRIIGPTGVDATDFEMVPTSDGIRVFKALSDGDFYIEYQAETLSKTFTTDYRQVPVISAKPTSDTNLSLQPEELKIVEFPVKPNQIMRTGLAGHITFELSAPATDGARENNDSAQSYGNNSRWMWFRVNRDSDEDVIRVFHGTGTALFAIRETGSKPETITLKSTETLQSWDSGEPLKSSIEIGESRMLLLKSTKSELMRVFAGASHFQPKLEIFRLNGELANSLMDRKKHTAGDDLYFPDADTFIVRLSCDGDGGSGDFLMKRDVLAPVPYALGSVQMITLDGVNFGLYSVNLEAGKRYELVTDKPENYLRVDLLDDDGQFLVSQAFNFGKVLVQYFVPTRTGRHRLWLRGSPGTRQFQLRPNVPPKIGG